MLRRSFVFGVTVFSVFLVGARVPANAATPGTPGATKAETFDPFTTTSTAATGGLIKLSNSDVIAASSSIQPAATPSNTVTVIVGVPEEADINQSTTGTTVAACVVTLSAPSTQTVTVQYTTSGGTASPTTDYVPTSGTLTFSPGETSKTVDVTLRKGSSSDNHLNEYFYFILSDATNATISTSGASKSQETVWIQGALATNLTVVGTTVPHGTSGTSTADVTVYLNNGGSSVVKVKIATDDGSAIQGIDYKSISQTLTFSPGQKSQTVPITIYGIPGHVATKYFEVYLSDSVNSYIEFSQFRANVTLTGH